MSGVSSYSATGMAFQPVSKLTVGAIIFLVASASLVEGRRKPRQTIFPDEDPTANEDETCRTPSGRQGICIRISRCAPIRSSMNIRLIRRSHCGFEGQEPKVCCPQRNRPPVNPTPTPTNRPVTRDNGRITPTQPTPRRNISAISEGKPAVLPDDCGRSSVAHTRIVNGQNALPKSWPWMAALWIGKGLRESLCGGTLVSNKHIITAAHCIVDRGVDTPPEDIRVRLGEHDIHSTNDGANPEDFGVVRVVRHESFNPRFFHNDIALIELNRTVRFSDAIFPACLPYDEVRNERLAERRGFITGWGSMSFGGPSSSILREAQIPIWEQEECIKPFRNISVPVTPEQFCAGTEDGSVDACEGDSGGPLVIPKVGQDIRYYLVGITSFGRQCATPGFAGVYTRVSSYLGWISRNLG